MDSEGSPSGSLPNNSCAPPAWSWDTERRACHCALFDDFGQWTRKGPQAVHCQTTRVLLLLGHGIPSVAHATVHCLTILGNGLGRVPKRFTAKQLVCSSCLVMGYRASRMPLCTV